MFTLSKHTVSVANPKGLAVLFSGLPASGLPSWFHHPFSGWPEPARHGASAPCLGAVSNYLKKHWGEDRLRNRQVTGCLDSRAGGNDGRLVVDFEIVTKFFKVITGLKFLAPCIGKRASKSVTGQFRGTGVADEQCPAAKKPRWHHDDSGVKPEALVNQPPLHTHPALGRRLDCDDPGVRSYVVPELPAGQLRGQYAVRGPASRAGPATGERSPSQDGPSAKPAPLLTHCLLTRPIPASACGHDQVPQINGRVQVPVMPGPAAGADPHAFTLEFRVHGPAGVAGHAAGGPLPPDPAHSGFGLKA